MDGSVPGRPARGIGHYLRDVVYGASDGIVTTLAIVAGSAGAALSPRVALILGVANLAADGISMGASNYLGLKSELEQAGRSVTEENPLRHGFATSAAFALAGAIPLLAYLLPTGISRFGGAAILAALALIGVGAARASFIGRSAMRCAAETLLVGGIACAAAYAAGAGIDAIVAKGPSA